MVAGSGAAGIAAAIAAARNGAQTLLIEYNGFLGGISATLGWIGFHDNRYRQVVKGLAAEFIDAYVATSGDRSLPVVLPFYMRYRAYVRGKVDAFQLDEPEIPEPQRRAARTAARRRFAQAERYATRRGNQPPSSFVAAVTPNR